MTRAATSFPDEWAPLFASRVKLDGRSESNYICRLIGADLIAAGLLPASADADSEFIAKVIAAVHSNPELKPVLEKFIREQARSRKGRVAA